MMMNSTRALLAAGLLVGASAAASAQTAPLTPIRVGFCAKTTTAAAAAAVAVATKMGWYAKDGIKVELVPIAGSGDCVKAVAT